MARSPRKTTPGSPPRGARTQRIAFAGASLGLALGLAWPPSAVGVDPAPASAQVPMLDPWVPPDARRPAAAPPTEGRALRAQVEAKLRAPFDAADVNHTGTLTRAQAKAAGLGYIVNHFDEIDRHKAGAVRFDDVKQYMREHGARLD